MNLEHIKYFLKIAEYKSISKAAIALEVSQPYLSSILKIQENELNFKIFDRTSRGVTLTSKGALFLDYCKEIQNYMDKIDSLKESSAQNSGFSVVTNFSYTMLNLYYQFNASQKNIANMLKFQETKNHTIPQLVSNNQFDIGIMHYESLNKKNVFKLLSDKDLIFTELFSEPLYAVVSKTHPLYNNASVQLRELKKYTLLIEKFKQNLEGYMGSSSFLFNIFKDFDIENMSFENNKSLFFFLSKSNTHFTLGQYSHNTSNPFVLNSEIKYLPITDIDITLITGYILKNNQRPSTCLNDFIKFIEKNYSPVI